MDARISEVLRVKGSKVYAVDGSASVAEAVDMMNERRLGSVLVVDNGRLAGILSERDILQRVIPLGRDAKTVSVFDAMTAEVLTISPAHRVTSVMQLMTEQRVRHLPVVEAGQVVGLVSIGDLTKWMSQDLEREVHDLSSYIVGAYVVGPYLA